MNSPQAPQQQHIPIQRFQAATAREALAMARAAFGDDTLILSNRQLANGVEVMASTEAALTSQATQTISAPHAAGEAARKALAPHSPLPLTQACEAAGTAAQPAVQAMPGAAEQSVHADTEQLAMSTLSFQDYVRERMLRRQQETLSAEAPTAGTPTPSAARAAPAAFAAPAAPGVDVATAVPAAFAAAAPVQTTVETPAVPPAAIAGFAAPSSDNVAGTVMAELHAMKRLMEDRFNTLSWLGQARQNPLHSNLMLKLVRAGYSPSLARTLLEPLAHETDPVAAVREVMLSLESMLGVSTDMPSMVDEGGVFALIGATGVGKTTTTAKLAAQCAALHGAASVGLVTLDTHRAGAHEHLRAYGRGMGVVAHLAHDRGELQELLALLSGKKMVLVDTAGVAPRDLRREELLGLLDLPSIKRVLVLNAGAHGDTLDEVATAFQPAGTGYAILSKTDEAAKTGPAIDTLIRHRLVLRGVADGQRVPQDWQAPDAAALVRASMRAPQRSAFDPRGADMDFYFSPADCAV
ncbi:MAG: flagellar biosynthesis protein FlhF [Janthinobacterium lividum]